MDEAVKWLGNHAAEKVSVDRLAAYMGYSRARLFTLFKEHTGLSPNNFLMRLRIGKAKDLLSEGTLSVKETALSGPVSGLPWISAKSARCRLQKHAPPRSPRPET